jgi:hypothetical protein
MVWAVHPAFHQLVDAETACRHIFACATGGLTESVSSVVEEVLPVNEGDGAFDGRFGGHERSQKRNNPTEALRRVSRVRSSTIVGSFRWEIKRRMLRAKELGEGPRLAVILYPGQLRKPAPASRDLCPLSIASRGANPETRSAPSRPARYVGGGTARPR